MLILACIDAPSVTHAHFASGGGAGGGGGGEPELSVSYKTCEGHLRMVRALAKHNVATMSQSHAASNPLKQQ